MALRARRKGFPPAGSRLSAEAGAGQGTRPGPGPSGSPGSRAGRRRPGAAGGRRRRKRRRRRAERGCRLSRKQPGRRQSGGGCRGGESLVVLRPRRSGRVGMEPVPREEKPNPLQDANLCSRLFFW